MDQNLLLILLLAVLPAVGALIYITLKKKPEEKPQDNSGILMMQEQLKELRIKILKGSERKPSAFNEAGKKDGKKL